MAPTAVTRTDSGLAARLAAISSLGAAAIHFAVLPTHWQEWTPAGVFFASIALFQLVWAFLVPVRPTAALLVAGILVNAGAAGLWVVSRTAGAPFGPHAGQAEVVEAAGICALLLECYVVMGAGWMWHRGRLTASISGFGNAIVLLGAGAVVAAASAAGMASGLQHGQHAPAGAEADHHAPIGGHDHGPHEVPKPVAPLDIQVDPAPAPRAPVDTPPPAADTSHEPDGHHGHE
ncbi:hypothetical protein ABGB19_15560 [Mycobacterium sp. B14F4]|uniref:hypothetical protein n=1 Tax=Mycobacterium sp. B14F4 TaxID=3153565 RepID=UPI00325DAE2C